MESRTLYVLISSHIQNHRRRRVYINTRIMSINRREEVKGNPQGGLF